MTMSKFLPIFSVFALQTTHIANADNRVSQINDGQVQAPATITDTAPETFAPAEVTSTTLETLTASAIISVTELNSTALVAAITSTTGSALPTSILMAAPADAEGAASNYTGLQTVAGESFPTPNISIPVNGTALPTPGGLNATATGLPSRMATLAPTNVGEDASSTSTEEPVAATGAASRTGCTLSWKGFAIMAAMLWAAGNI